MNTWNELENCLRAIYEEQGVLVHLSNDADYLERAFRRTEYLWEEQFQQIDRINFILLGEAPLYGSNKSYFYNEDSDYTAFFRHEIYPYVKSTSLSKPELLQHLREWGVFILDLFPFAFNDDTAMSYRRDFRSNNMIKNLFEGTYESYFMPKLKKIQEKSHENTLFSFRYKKQYGVLAETLQTRLNEVDFFFDISDIGCVGSNNHPIDATKLEKQFRKSIKVSTNIPRDTSALENEYDNLIGIFYD